MPKPPNQLRLCKVCYSYFCFKGHDDILEERHRAYDLAMAKTYYEQKEREKSVEPRKYRRYPESELDRLLKEVSPEAPKGHWLNPDNSVPSNPPRTHDYDYPFPKREELPKKQTNEMFSSKYWISAYDNEYFWPGKGSQFLPMYEPGYSRKVRPSDPTVVRGYHSGTQYNFDFPFHMHIPGTVPPVTRLPEYSHCYGNYPLKDTVEHTEKCTDRFYAELIRRDLPQAEQAEILCNYHDIRPPNHRVHNMADMGLHPDPDHERRRIDKCFHLREDQEKLGLKKILNRGEGGFWDL